MSIISKLRHKTLPIEDGIEHEKTASDTKSDLMFKNQEFTPKIDPKDPKLLDTIARRYTRITGESKNIKTLFCCFVSKDLPKKFRTSPIVINPSSTGKSYFINNVLEPFKDKFNNVLDYTDFTEAHFKRSQTDVDGKIIKLEQLERKDDKGQLSLQKLKHLLTEGRLNFGVAESDGKGKFVAKDFTIIGTPIIVTTTTSSNIDQETLNRFIQIQLDESEQQTERIFDYTLDDYSQIGLEDYHNKNLEELKKYCTQLKEAAHHIEGILIPFADKTKSLLPKSLEMRRDLNKILNLMCIVAFIHCANRDTFTNNEGKHFFTGDWVNTEKQNTYYLIAKPEDFMEACDIAGDTIKQTINKVPAKLMEFQALLKEEFNKKSLDENHGVTVKEIVKASTNIGREYSPNRVREYLNELAERGFANKEENYPENLYAPTEKKFSELKPTNITFTEQEYEDWIKKQLSQLGGSYSFVPSCPQKEAQNEPLSGKEAQNGHEDESREVS